MAYILQAQSEHRVQRSFVWINKLLNQSLTLKNVYTCRLARLISPMGSLWIYCKRFLRFLSDPDRLCCSPFWKSITASHSLAGARHVARRATEDRRPKGDRGTRIKTPAVEGDFILATVRDDGHHFLSVLALYWKDRIGNQKSGTGIEDRGPVIGDR